MQAPCKTGKGLDSLDESLLSPSAIIIIENTTKGWHGLCVRLKSLLHAGTNVKEYSGTRPFVASYMSSQPIGQVLPHHYHNDKQISSDPPNMR